MNIAFVIQDTGKLYGAERVTLELAARLSREPDLEVVLCLIEETRLGLDRSDIRDRAEQVGLDVKPFPVRRAFSLNLIRQIRAWGRSASIDIFHVTGPKAVFHVVPATWGCPVKCISTVHGWLFRKDLKEQVYAALDGFMLRRCARVVVLSRYYQYLLLERRIDTDRLVRIPTGIDMIPVPDTTARDSSAFTVGFAGRMSEEKQPHIILSVARMSLSWSMPVRFKMAGDGPLLESLKAEAERLGVQSVVEFLGYVPSDRFLPDMDLLVNCSSIENLPYSILEAMRLGIPVVAFDVGGIPDLIEDGENGYRVRSGDVEEMAAKLKMLASDRALAQQMGVAGRQKVSEEYSPKRGVQAHKALYQSCLPPARR